MGAHKIKKLQIKPSLDRLLIHLYKNKLLILTILDLRLLISQLFLLRNLVTSQDFSNKPKIIRKISLQHLEAPSAHLMLRLPKVREESKLLIYLLLKL